MQRNKIQKYMIALGSLLLTACLQKPISEPLQDQPSAEKQQKPDREPLLVRVVNGKRFEIPKGYFDSDEPEPYLENFGNDPSKPQVSRVELFKFELPSWQPQTLMTGESCVKTYVKTNRPIFRSELPKINDCEKQLLNASWSAYDRSSYVVDGPRPNDAHYSSDSFLQLMDGKIELEHMYGLVSFSAPISQEGDVHDVYFYPTRERPTTMITCTPRIYDDIQSPDQKGQRDLIASCSQRFIMEDLQVNVGIGYHRSRLPQWQDMEAKMRAWIKQHQVQSS